MKQRKTQYPSNDPMIMSGVNEGVSPSIYTSINRVQTQYGVIVSDDTWKFVSRDSKGVLWDKWRRGQKSSGERNGGDNGLASCSDRRMCVCVCYWGLTRGANTNKGEKRSTKTRQV